MEVSIVIETIYGLIYDYADMQERDASNNSGTV